MVLGDERRSDFVCLDIDRPEMSEAKTLLEMARKGPTRVVQTPHGFQVIWNSPTGFPSLRSDLKGQNGEVFGQLLSHGYVVASGSKVRCDGHKHSDSVSCGTKTYTLENDAPPAPAPPGVVALGTELASKSRNNARETPETDALSLVPAGRHDKFGADLAYNLRKWGGLDEEAIRRFFTEGGLKGVISALGGYNPSAPFTQDDADRWARSAARATASDVLALPAGMPTAYLEEDETESFADCGFIEAPLRWWIRGFIPRGHLVALYGKGGRGKSSLGSWILGEVTHRKCAAGIFCVEESPKLFAARAIIGGADRTLIHSARRAGEWLFPRDLERLNLLIQRKDLKFVWFDSLYSHFEHVEGKTQSTQARVILGQMEVMCREADCTIIGVFHENKGGSYLGPTEMENVVRVMLHASRSLKGTKAPLKVKVAKTNMPFRPETYLKFTAEKMPLCDPESGEVQMEEIEPGRMEPLMIPIAQRAEDGFMADEEIDDVLEAVDQAGAFRSAAKTDAL
jgi:hypothetical protein